MGRGEGGNSSGSPVSRGACADAWKGAVSGISGRSVMSIKNHNYEILNHNDEFEKS